MRSRIRTLRVDRQQATRVAALAGLAVLGISTLPGMLKTPDPPPVPADVGFRPAEMSRFAARPGPEELARQTALKEKQAKAKQRKELKARQKSEAQKRQKARARKAAKSRRKQPRGKSGRKASTSGSEPGPGSGTGPAAGTGSAAGPVPASAPAQGTAPSQGSAPAPAPPPYSPPAYTPAPASPSPSPAAPPSDGSQEFAPR